MGVNIYPVLLPSLLYFFLVSTQYLVGDGIVFFTLLNKILLQDFLGLCVICFLYIWQITDESKDKLWTDVGDQTLNDYKQHWTTTDRSEWPYTGLNDLRRDSTTMDRTEWP